MRIVVDLQGAQAASRYRGIGRYSLDLTLGLARNKGEHEIVVALSDLFPDTIDYLRGALKGLLPAEAIRVWTAPGAVAGLDPSNDRRRRDAELIREAFIAALKPDAVLITSLFEGLGDDAVTSVGRLAGLPTAVVLYDLIPLLNQTAYLTNDTRKSWYFAKISHLRRSDLLLSISKSAGDEAVTALGWSPQRLANISTAASPRFQPIPPDGKERALIAERYALQRDYLMYTGGLEPRKNVEGLIRSYGALPEIIRATHQLAIVGNISLPEKEHLLALAVASGLQTSDVVVTGFVDDHELVRLYNYCKAFIFPSFHEGFGLPALEAMQCGRAVIAANTSSLPEVVGLEEALFDPYDDADMAARIERVLADDVFRARLESYGLEHARKFSWDLTASRALRAIEDNFGKSAAASSGTVGRSLNHEKPRLAFVSPLPPARSGIADYSADLLPVLAQYYDVDVIVDQAEISDPWISANLRIRDKVWLRANANRFDRVVYQFGNSPLHAYMFDLLEEIPGIVVLHDFFLSSVLSHSFPSDWQATLLRSHGYHALIGNGDQVDQKVLVRQFPANLAVLQNALNVILHSQHTRGLGRYWYGEGAGESWPVIPLLRIPASSGPGKQSEARRALGIDADVLLICSFGFVDAVKLSQRVLDTFLASSLAGNSRAMLVFVGEQGQTEYCKTFARTIVESNFSDRIKITGWAERDDYVRYLQAADIAVQLRTDSRGETSAAILDCMNYGIATISNANGSMNELDREAVWLLPDRFNDLGLIEALEKLAADPGLRLGMGSRAAGLVHTRHAPEACAEAYHAVIEATYRDTSLVYQRLPERLDDTATPISERIAAVTLAANFPPDPRPKQLLLDVSQLASTELHTGIQRVSRAVVLDLLRNPPKGWAVEPIRRTDGGNFLYARTFTARFLGIDLPSRLDVPVDAWAGDIYLDMDHHPGTPSSQSVVDVWRRRGVSVFHVVYDLLPIRMPQMFPDISAFFRAWLDRVAQATGALCISRAVAEDLAEWMRTDGPTRPVPLEIGWFHLGADVGNSVPTRGLPGDSGHVLTQLAQRPTFLMVGTIEPRKGYRQTLAAFEALWARGVDVNLVIVGKPGWGVDDLVARLGQHTEASRRLFWPRDVSDEYLERLYAAANCLIAASEGEGFGLPLIEAAQHGLPILARSLPVFREIAGSHAAYFDGLSADDLAGAIATWLAAWREGRHVSSHDMMWLDWHQCTLQLLRGLGIGKQEIAGVPESIESTASRL